MCRGSWLWEAPFVVFYEIWRLREAQIVVSYVSGSFWEAQSIVFHVCGRLGDVGGAVRCILRDSEFVGSSKVLYIMSLGVS